MAKQPEDMYTPDLLPPAKRRGRPPTGAAQSASARKRAQRARDRARVWSSELELDVRNMTTSGLLEGLAQAIQHRGQALAQALAAELVRRAA